MHCFRDAKKSRVGGRITSHFLSAIRVPEFVSIRVPKTNIKVTVKQCQISICHQIQIMFHDREYRSGWNFDQALTTNGWSAPFYFLFVCASLWNVVWCPV